MSGKLTEVIPSQSSKALSPIETSPFGSVTEVKPLNPLNAESPTEVIPISFGITKFVSDPVYFVSTPFVTVKSVFAALAGTARVEANNTVHRNMYSLLFLIFTSPINELSITQAVSRPADLISHYS